MMMMAICDNRNTTLFLGPADLIGDVRILKEENKL
jgi:hypothetical protein